jgi:hypothetical protein
MRRILLMLIVVALLVAYLWTMDTGPEGEQCNQEGAVMATGQDGTFYCRTTWYGDLQWHQS